jgi:hypothetical protein
MDGRRGETRPRPGVAERRLIVRVAILIAAAAALAPAAANPPVDLTATTFFRPAVNVSHTGNASSLPHSSPHSLALDAHGPALLFWVESVPHTKGIAHEMALARFVPVAGWDTTYSPVGRWEGDPSTEPACALDPSRTLHLVWLEQRGGVHLIEGLHFRLATGEMTQNEVISDTTRWAADPAVCADAWGHAHVVWSELDRGESRIAYREWSPEAGWSAIAHVPTVTGASTFGPDIAVAESGRLRASWQETIAKGSRVAFTTRMPGGDWQKAVFLSDDRPGFYVSPPIVAGAPSGEGAMVVWQESDGKATRIVMSDVTGKSPGKPIELVAGNQSQVEHPAAALDSGGSLHVLWIDRTAAADAVMYARRPPGAPLGEPRPLTLQNTGPFDSPTLAADLAGRVCAVWVDRSVGHGDIMVRSGLASFGPPLSAVQYLEP